MLINKNLFVFVLLSVLTFCSFQSNAERIKDITSVHGVRENQLIGYGLVVGLDGTGEKTKYTEQTFRTMLGRFGINVPAGGQLKLKNTAAVAIHTSLPAFAKTGQTLDVTVSSIGEAKSLRGGTLLMTPLKGVNGKTYAIAQGNLIVGGFGIQGRDGSSISLNIPTVGRIPNGATVEQTVPSPFLTDEYIVFNLNQPDFTTAVNLAKTINRLVGSETAKPMDSTSIKVSAPRDSAQRISYLSVIENLQVKPAEAKARIVVNSRTGTIVIGKNIHLKEAAIAHGSLIIKIKERLDVSQPAPFSEQGTTEITQDSQIDITQTDSRMFHFQPGATLQELVEAVNAVGAAPGDVMAILEALKIAGALSGELIVI
ncbi:MAG: flagellar biosynthesis protein FlgI [Kangiella sp.]|nr:MAG: flagellar biosynthesis protein FlgI [Kangiella sp.]